MPSSHSEEFSTTVVSLPFSKEKATSPGDRTYNIDVSASSCYPDPGRSSHPQETKPTTLMY